MTDQLITGMRMAGFRVPAMSSCLHCWRRPGQPRTVPGSWHGSSLSGDARNP